MGRTRNSHVFILFCLPFGQSFYFFFLLVLFVHPITLCNNIRSPIEHMDVFMDLFGTGPPYSKSVVNFYV